MDQLFKKNQKSPLEYFTEGTLLQIFLKFATPSVSLTSKVQTGDLMIYD